MPVLETVFIHILAVIIFFTVLKDCYSNPLSHVEVGCDHGVLGQTTLCLTTSLHMNADAYAPPPTPLLKIHKFLDIKHIHSAWLAGGANLGGGWVNALNVSAFRKVEPHLVKTTLGKTALGKWVLYLHCCQSVFCGVLHTTAIISSLVFYLSTVGKVMD